MNERIHVHMMGVKWKIEKTKKETKQPANDLLTQRRKRKKKVEFMRVDSGENKEEEKEEKEQKRERQRARERSLLGIDVVF